MISPSRLQTLIRPSFPSSPMKITKKEGPPLAPGVDSLKSGMFRGWKVRGVDVLSGNAERECLRSGGADWRYMVYGCRMEMLLASTDFPEYVKYGKNRDHDIV